MDSSPKGQVVENSVEVVSTSDVLVSLLENDQTNNISGEDEGQSTDELHCSNIIAYGPNGTISWVPNVPDDQKPIVGTLFESLDAVYVMYETYGEKAGFDVRRSSEKTKNGEVTHKWFVCSRAGKPIKKSVNTLEDMAAITTHKKINYDNIPKKRKKSSKREQRNSNFKVTGCEARVKVKSVAGTSSWCLYCFDEHHNHILNDEENVDLSRLHRQLLFPEQKFIHRLSTSNIGPTIAHRLISCLKGGAHRVRGTATDFKNFRRDMNRYVGDRDAQMLVDKMNNRKMHVPNFSFDYKCEDNELTCMFWADETSKCNYAEFGSILAFDATFRTNKYCMVFVPFTGVDNHYRCVTFGAGLLISETIESYTWLLEAFMKAHGKQPRLVVTDQDPAMRQAIPSVFTEAQHRLCMWHITNKLPIKVCADTLKNTDLRKRFHKLVWNVHLDPAEFESRIYFIKDFNLSENKWFTNLWNIRTSWIPGYFKDVPMCGLMKTTSHSESSNSFFRTYSHHGNNLVQFMICFESAMEKQRHTQRLLDHATSSTSPTFLTHLKIERHAAMVYTREIFLMVQKEIFKGVWFCSQKSFVSEGVCKICTIKHKDKNSQVIAEYEVVFNQTEGSIVCGCKHFVRHGVLCRHIFCVLGEYNIQEIPDQYVLRHWRRDVLPRELMNNRHRYDHSNDSSEKLVKDAYDSLDYCITRLRHDLEKLSVFVDKVQKLRSETDVELPNHKAHSQKEEVFNELLGVSSPQTVEVKVPKGARNKGCGTGKRMIGPGEMSASKSKRSKRMCKTCGKKSYHDSRNCPKKAGIVEDEGKQSSSGSDEEVSSDSE